MKLTRRCFVAGTAVLPFHIWVEKAGAAGPVLTRPEARTAQGKAMLKLYQVAVANMKNTPEGAPTSWVFQSYTHWVKGDMARAAQVKAAEIARIYRADAKYKSLATEMWETCQAHGDTDDENYFLPWHRMFVYFFERIVRKAAGNPDFVLPYWNYSASGPTHGVIPDEFTVAAGSLYVAKRNQGVNNHQPIDARQPDALNLDSLSQPSYEPSGPLAGFCADLDGKLHGNVHVLIGNVMNMGQVPWAAGDPIFWLHHCNIDRLWASWNKNGGKNPTSAAAFMSKTFVFADENGNRVAATVKDFLDTGQLNYNYDRLEPAPPNFKTAPGDLTLGAALPATPTHRASQIAVGSAPVAVRLEPLPSVGTFAARVSALSNRRIYLVVRDLKVAAQPGVLYDVYMNLPAGASPAAASGFRVGVFNFFNAMHYSHAAGSAPKFLSFDITDTARKLSTRGQLNEKPVITIAPVGKPAADAKTVIGQITLVER